MGMFDWLFGTGQQYQNPYTGGLCQYGLGNLAGPLNLEQQAAMHNQAFAMHNQACAQAYANQQQVVNPTPTASKPEYDIDGTCEDVTDRKLLTGPGG